MYVSVFVIYTIFCEIKCRYVCGILLNRYLWQLDNKMPKKGLYKYVNRIYNSYLHPLGFFSSILKSFDFESSTGLISSVRGVPNILAKCTGSIVWQGYNSNFFWNYYNPLKKYNKKLLLEISFIA